MTDEEALKVISGVHCSFCGGRLREPSVKSYSDETPSHICDDPYKEHAAYKYLKEKLPGK